MRDRRRRGGTSHYGIGRTLIVLRDLLALPFIRRDPKKAEIAAALATAAIAALGALLYDRSPAAALALDIVALCSASVWWNIRRFNRAQSEGVYRVRRGNESPCSP